jgi:hypothetical protein
VDPTLAQTWKIHHPVRQPLPQIDILDQHPLHRVVVRIDPDHRSLDPPRILNRLSRRRLRRHR